MLATARSFSLLMTQKSRKLLIDGSRTSGQITTIKEVRQSIQDQYKPDSSLVIMHWDSDHYTGVLRMMIDDLEERLRENHTRDLQVSFLRYDSTGTPTSILYVPYQQPQAANPLKGIRVTHPIKYLKDGKEFGFGGKEGVCMQQVGKVVADMDFATVTDKMLTKSQDHQLFKTHLDISVTAQEFDLADTLSS